jgi:transposase-like protein
MGKMRKQFSKEFKAKVSLEAMKGLKTTAEISSEYKVHATQITQWKKELQEALPGIFSGRKDPQEKQQKELIDNLYKRIGELAVENDWFKKKLPI